MFKPGDTVYVVHDNVVKQTTIISSTEVVRKERTIITYEVDIKDVNYIGSSKVRSNLIFNWKHVYASPEELFEVLKNGL